MSATLNDLKPPVFTEKKLALKNSNIDVPNEQVFTALTNKEIGASELYRKSGLQSLMKPLLDDLSQYIAAGFIEVSTYASTLHNDSLDAFNISFVNGCTEKSLKRQFHSNVSHYFKPIIAYLRDKNLILFNHPDFATKPKEFIPFISSIDARFGDIYGSDILKPVNEKYHSILPGLKQKESEIAISKDMTFNHFNINIRRSNINDEFTTYRGIRELKPKLVKRVVDKEFKDIEDPEMRLFALHYLNHKLYHEKFQENISRPYPSVMISIPLLSPHPALSSRYIGLGATFIYLMLNIDNEEEFAAFREKLTAYCEKALNIVRNYLIGYVFQIGVDKLLQFEREATKSAIAAVMSRNMSHNIGSHVLVKLSEEKNLNSFQDMTAFNQYLKHRMSFIADISTSQTSNSGTNFIENDILNKFRTLLLLKNNISGNDLINADSIRINYWSNFPGLPAATDMAIQVPGDTIGKHAFYIFMENFIRNAVKYSSIASIARPKRPGMKAPDAPQYNLELNICVSEPKGQHKDSFYIIDVFDNCSQVNFEERKKGTLINEKKPGKGNCFKLLKKLQSDIDRSLLTNGAPRVGGWGILEMKICAVFLRRYPLKDIDICPTRVQQPKILEANYYKIENGNPVIIKFGKKITEGDLNLGYRFYVLKPKKIAFDHTFRERLSETEIKKLEFDGIYFIKKEVSAICNGIDHDIYVSENTEAWRNEKMLTGTQRILLLTEQQNIKNIQKALTGADVKNIENMVWELYSAQMGYTGQVRIYKSSKPVSVPEEEQEGLIVLDHHGIHATAICSKLPDNKIDLRNSKVLYYEVYGSQSGTCSYIERMGDSEQKGLEISTARLKEVAHINMIILDERIQRAAHLENAKLNQVAENSVVEVPLYDIFYKMKIYIPHHEKDINLDKQSFIKQNDVDLKEIEAWIEKTLQEHPVRFLLIHLSLIEKLKDASTDAIDKFYRAWAKRWDHVTFIIISGRGEPSTIPPKSYFIPYDCIEEYLLRNRSKFNLVNLIYCTTKKQ